MQLEAHHQTQDITVNSALPKHERYTQLGLWRQIAGVTRSAALSARPFIVISFSLTCLLVSPNTRQTNPKAKMVRAKPLSPIYMAKSFLVVKFLSSHPRYSSSSCQIADSLIFLQRGKRKEASIAIDGMFTKESDRKRRKDTHLEWINRPFDHLNQSNTTLESSIRWTRLSFMSPIQMDHTLSMPWNHDGKVLYLLLYHGESQTCHRKARWKCSQALGQLLQTSQWEIFQGSPLLKCGVPWDCCSCIW